MTIARQRFGKHRLRAGIVEPELRCWATVHLMHNRPMCGRSAGIYRDLGNLNKET
jgi:hypothetical protein